MKHLTYMTKAWKTKQSVSCFINKNFILSFSSSPALGLQNGYWEELSLSFKGNKDNGN